MFFYLGRVILDSTKESIILNAERNNIQPKISAEGQKLRQLPKTLKS